MGTERAQISARDGATEIVRVLRAAGHAAYFAGGCVRDELLGLVPEDYDVATDAPPVKITSLFRRTSEVGASFGVVIVRTGGVAVEVATFRSEGPYSDRRRPDSVTFSDAPTDARRRDFTINGLFLDPLDTRTPPQSSRGGAVIDFVEGLPDLERRVLRAVGDPDERLAEDHLRALRAVRLTARLGLTLDGATGAAIRRHARELAGVSRERVGEEVRKVLLHPSRARGVELLNDLGLDAPVLDEAPSFRPAGGVLAGVGAVEISVAVALAAWALDRGIAPDAPGAGEAARRWRRALCLSNEETEQLKATMVGVGLLERDWASMGVAGRKRAAASGWFEGSLRLVGVRSASAEVEISRAFEAMARTPSGIAPRPLVTGDDLIASGLSPGPSFKPVLERVYDAQLEDRVRTHEEALRLAVRLAVRLATEPGIGRGV